MVFIMSSVALKPIIVDDPSIDLINLFSTLDSLVNVSSDDPPLEMDDALDYITDIAFTCPN